MIFRRTCEITENVEMRKVFMTSKKLISKKETAGPRRREPAWHSQLGPRVPAEHNKFLLDIRLC